MGAKDKDKSLLEIARELLATKKNPEKILTIAKEVTDIKGLKKDAAKEATPQFLADFMESGYFVYCGDDCWDLKERQSTSVIDKDGSDYVYIGDDDDEVKNNELKDEDIEPFAVKSSDDTEEEENTDEPDDDISSMLGDSVEKDLAEDLDSEEVETGYEEIEE